MAMLLEAMRPSPEIRSKLDFGYRVEGQSVVLFEKRPYWDNPAEVLQMDFAKATFIRASNEWKVYWMRASDRWEVYSPRPSAQSLGDWIGIVREDAHGCFFG